MDESYLSNFVEQKDKIKSKKNFLPIILFGILLSVSLCANIFIIYLLNKNGFFESLAVLNEGRVGNPVEQVDVLPEKTQQQLENQNDGNKDEKYKYLIKEFGLLMNSQLGAQSKLFGFRFHPFHADWECNNSGLNYTADGVSVTCSQKQCSLAKDLKYPDFIQAERSQECKNELENREFPFSVLPSFVIDVSAITIGDNQTLADLDGFVPNEITPKGTSYQFNKIESDDQHETGYSKRFEVTFYSPKLLSDQLSVYTGMMYGSEKIYAKYNLSIDLYETVGSEQEISEEKFKELINKIIDSIEFLDPIN